ncbi:MAG: U32 family peptidase [Gammaproteobacteria bacterium]|nr:U32 family peptidase [Gammaproteobacteria bacterium]
MNKTFELLAPGGDIDSMKAAIVAGADAIYCGLDSFNARNRAVNISFENLTAIIKISHQYNCQIFLTINIIILEQEIPALLRLLNKLVNTHIDGLIVQDQGLFYLLAEHFKTLAVHASTQVTTHNEGQIKFLNKLGVNRTNLSRELDINEIKSLSAICHQYKMLAEVFVHGSNCIGYSGLCYISSAHGGNSGNRGRCSQPCRDQYQTTRAGKDFPLNIKDNSAFFDLPALSDAGIDSLKIEGRVKKPHYVYTVVDSWRKQLDSFSDRGQTFNDNTNLYSVFNRDFSNGFLKGDINNNMFIDNPRDHSVKHFVQEKGYSSSEEIQSVKQQLYDEKTEIINIVKEKTNKLILAKIPLTINISGKLNGVLKVTLITTDESFDSLSQSKLTRADKPNVTYQDLEKKFGSLSNSLYQIVDINFNSLEPDLFIPFKELTAIKKNMAYFFNDSKEIVAPISVPKLKRQKHKTGDALIENPILSVLISCKKDLQLCNSATGEIYYQLPNSIAHSYSDLVEIFSENSSLIPWFPSIIIGDDYKAAIDFLNEVQPKQIITNNTGIAFAAFDNGINWIAGPYLNITNSYSLICMKEKFNCVGSFISNEINKRQIQQISCPCDFKLYYSIYHPILLLSSRQCLFFQTTGCKKQAMDDECLAKCKKSTSIINMKKASFIINKNTNEQNCMYGNYNFLNTDIVTELPNTFAGFFIDLRNIKTGTTISADKAEIIHSFQSLLAGKEKSVSQIKKIIQLTTNEQYKKGL